MKPGDGLGPHGQRFGCCQDCANGSSYLCQPFRLVTYGADSLFDAQATSRRSCCFITEQL